MKKLRFSIDVRPYRVPEPRVQHIGPRDEHNLTAFQSQNLRYRRRKRTAVALMVGFLVLCAVLAKTRLGNALGVWGLVLLLVCWVGGVAVLLFGLRRTCPACRKQLTPAKGRYCPLCGSAEFDRGRHRRESEFGRVAFCPACDGTIYDGDNEQPRTYRIRGCTHCGVLLDERGV